MQAGNYFGTSVAVHGEFAMVSAPGAEYGDSLAGEAFLFHYGAGVWSQVAKVAVPNSRHLGIQTSLTEGYGLLGSCSEAAYVFAYNEQGVTQTSVLRGSDSLAGDYFGRNGIAIDGNWAVAAAPQHDEKGQNSGSAYVFHLEGGNWTQTQELTASNAATDSYFGANASIKGGLLVVGADYTVPGSAYVFQNNGTTWAETARIQAGDGIDHDYFGWAVSTDGSNVLAGAFAERSAGSFTGAAYVFEIPEPATLSLLAVLALSSTLRLRPKGACRSGAGWR
jgi:hypothetical protein